MSNIKTGDILNFDYTGTVQTVTLPKGTYKLECWGAQGGYSSSNSGIEVGMGGKGGYSAGTITLNQKTLIYIYTGGVGSISGNGKADGGFPNGGSSWASSTSEGAGGGGGSSSENSLTTKYGGGTTGGSSASGYGATQTAAGTNGSFGQGGSATTSGTNYNYGSGGGGGGWYGGGACSDYSDSTNYRGYNGGGSGYVYTSATAANYPSGNYVNSSYYLTNAQTIAGNQSFKSPDGTNETGHTGNGFCRITRKSGKIFVKQNGSWIKV